MATIYIGKTGNKFLQKKEIKAILDALKESRRKGEIPAISYAYHDALPWEREGELLMLTSKEKMPEPELRRVVQKALQKDFGNSYEIDDSKWPWQKRNDNNGKVSVRTVPDSEVNARERKPWFSIHRRSSKSSGSDLGGDIVHDRHGRHLRL